MKLDIKDYHVVTHSSFSGLEHEVKRQIGLGWQPQGGVSVDPTSHLFMQAMIEIREDFLEHRA